MSESATVVIATNDFRPLAGGIARCLHDAAQALARTRQVLVMTSVAQPAAAWERQYDLRPLPPLPERRLGHRPGDAVSPIRRAHTALHFLALRRYAADVVRAVPHGAAVLIGLWDTASHFWCEACRHAGIPYRLFAHGLEITDPMYSRARGWRRTDFANADGIVATSRATADLVAARFAVKQRPAVVNPCVGPRPPAAAVAADAARLRRSLGIEHRDASVLLSVGRLVARKGFDLVLRSVADLSARHPDLRYVIVGEGPERARLERLAGELGIASRVTLLGQVDEATKWAAYDVADVFVMPNRTLGGNDWEGFGIVFGEAALSGRPAIGGVSGGAGDAIADGTTGLLVDPERPGALTDAIVRLLDDSSLRARFGRCGIERARTLFSFDALAASLEEAFGSAPRGAQPAGLWSAS